MYRVIVIRVMKKILFILLLSLITFNISADPYILKLYSEEISINFSEWEPRRYGFEFNFDTNTITIRTNNNSSKIINIVKLDRTECNDDNGNYVLYQGRTSDQTLVVYLYIYENGIHFFKIKQNNNTYIYKLLEYPYNY